MLDKLNKLYELVLSGKELTSKSLKGIGLNNKNINLLIKNEVLEKVKIKNILDIFNRRYNFKNLDGLISYLKTLEDIDSKKAIAGYEKILENNEDKIISLKLLLLYLKNNEYDKAFKLLNIYNNSDYNFYLYLFSMLTKLDDSYIARVKNFKYKDYEIIDNTIDDSVLDILNNIRLSAYKHKFHDAILLMNNLNKDNISNQILLVLLEKINEIDSINKNNDLSLVKNKQYKRVVEVLEERSRWRNLGIIENYTLLLTKKLLELKENHIIDEINNKESNTVFDAINNKDYKLALNIIEKYCRDRKTLRSDNILFLLLREIVIEIELIEKADMLDLSNIELEELPSVEETINDEAKTQLFEQITSMIKENKLCEVKKYIKEWLDLIGECEYEFLILDLINIIKLESYNSIDKLLDILNKLNDNSYHYRLGEYIIKFYEVLNNKEINKARIYLDIIKNSDKLGFECRLTGPIEMLVEEEKYGKKYKKIRKNYWDY